MNLKPIGNLPHTPRDAQTTDEKHFFILKGLASFAPHPTHRAGGTTYGENYFVVTTPVRRGGIHKWISGVTGADLQGNFFLFCSSSLPCLPDHVNKTPKCKLGHL